MQLLETPGEGYRFLRMDEQIDVHDEFYDGEGWRAVEATAEQLKSGFPIRRKATAKLEIVRGTIAKFTQEVGREIEVRFIHDPRHGQILGISCEDSLILIPNGANGACIKQV